jgi:hypothetical protein
LTFGRSDRRSNPRKPQHPCGVPSAPERIRTSDLRFRRPTLSAGVVRQLASVFQTEYLRMTRQTTERGDVCCVRIHGPGDHAAAIRTSQRSRGLYGDASRWSSSPAADGAPNNGLGTPPFVEEQQSGPALPVPVHCTRFGLDHQRARSHREAVELRRCADSIRAGPSAGITSGAAAAVRERQQVPGAEHAHPGAGLREHDHPARLSPEMDDARQVGSLNR